MELSELGMDIPRWTESDRRSPPQFKSMEEAEDAWNQIVRRHEKVSRDINRADGKIDKLNSVRDPRNNGRWPEEERSLALDILNDLTSRRMNQQELLNDMKHYYDLMKEEMSKDPKKRDLGLVKGRIFSLLDKLTDNRGHDYSEILDNCDWDFELSKEPIKDKRTSKQKLDERMRRKREPKW